MKDAGFPFSSRVIAQPIHYLKTITSPITNIQNYFLNGPTLLHMMKLTFRSTCSTLIDYCTHTVQLIIQTYHDSHKLDDYVNNYDNNGAKKDEGVSEKHSYHYQVEERK